MALTSTSRTRSRAFELFLGATFLSQLGNAAALLASTIVSSDAGSTGARSATFTAIMLALNFGPATLATPYTANIAARLGARRLYGLTQLAGAAVYGLVALGIIAGLPGYPLLLVAAPVLGLIGGMSHTVSPITLRAYSGDEDLAKSESQTSMASGLAWVIGGLGGATLVGIVGAPAAFIANVLLTIPLVVVVLAVRPPGTETAVAAVARPWRQLIGTLRGNRAVSRAALIGIASAVLVSPFASMVVPVTRDLQHTLAIHAGIILACIAVGEMLSPTAVSAMSRVGHRLRPAWVAYLVAGLVLVGIGVIVSAIDGGPEVVAVAAFGVIFGAVNSGGSSFLVRDAAAESTDETREADLAAFFLSVGLGIPIGTLMWGQVIQRTSAAHVLVLSGLAMAVFVVALVFLRRDYERAHRGHDVPSAPAGLPVPHGVLRRLGV